MVTGHEPLDLVDGIKLHSLLPAVIDCGGKYSFWAGDVKEEFYRNANKHRDPSWKYHVEKVTYTVNTRGYRCDELDKIDWANSVVMLGCSFVFGEGLDDVDTLPSQLSRTTNLPVINLGVCGSGPEWQLHNMTLLRKYYPPPRAVLCLWPAAGRNLHYTSPYEIFHGGPWNMQQGSATDLWNQGANPGTHVWMAHQQAQYLWAGVSPYIAAAWQANVSQALGIHHMDKIWQDLPKARDLRHPGKDATYLAAKQLQKLLKEQNVVYR